MNYEVIVSNIGTVYSGSNGLQAFRTYVEYEKLSGLNTGRASGESVCMMRDGEVLYEYCGSLYQGEV